MARRNSGDDEIVFMQIGNSFSYDFESQDVLSNFVSSKGTIFLEDSMSGLKIYSKACVPGGEKVCLLVQPQGSDSGQLMEVSSSIENAAYDEANGKIYVYTEDRSIIEVSRDGSGTRLLQSSLEEDVDGMYFHGGNLYLEFDTDLYKLNIALNEMVLIKSVDYYRASYAVYEGQIYWTDSSGLYRENLDGSEREKVSDYIMYLPSAAIFSR